MLLKRFDRGFVSDNLVDRAQFAPFPTAAQRDGWLKLDETMRRSFIEAGQKALTQPWPALPASIYLKFYRTGDREEFQNLLSPRRTILRDLVLAECAEGAGRFVEPVMDALWSTCEESSWTLPAHIPNMPDYAGLPNVDYPVPAILANEVAAMLAWSVYLLRETLDAACPEVARRIEREITVRLLRPCLERDDHWWMSRHGEHVNNWNPWSNSNWLACVLLIEADRARRIDAVIRIMDSLDRFYDAYGPDGGCDEGPGYWARAAASFFEALNLLDKGLQGGLDVFHDAKLRAMGRFPLNTCIGEGWIVNFADASARSNPNGDLLAQYGRRIGDAELEAFGHWLRRRANAQSPITVSTLPRTLSALFDAPPPPAATPEPNWPAHVYMSDIQVLCARSRPGSNTGLFLAAKGGHNDESHNHNDVGQFIVYHGARPLLIDAGVGIYRRETFSAHRYEIWTMPSRWHNLPTIDGVQQATGDNYYAQEVTTTCDDKRAALHLDIAPAYPPEAKLTRWRRTVTLDRTAEVVVLSDEADFAQAPATVEMSLLTPCDVVVQPARIVLKAASLPQERTTAAGMIDFDPAVWEYARVEQQAIDDAKLSAVWGRRLYRIILTARPTKPQLASGITVRPT